MTFLGGLLLYHLAKGTWTSDNLGTGANHSIISTQLTGHKVSFLEGDRPQVIACGIPNQSSEINIYNQALQTVVLNTNTYQGITIHTINHVISFPGFYSSALGMLGLTKFPNVQQDAGVSNSTLDNTTGFTVFAFTDMAYGNNAAKVTGVSSQALFNNHVSNPPITGCPYLTRA
jgi:hypothetical protein